MATVIRKIQARECDWHPGVDAVGDPMPFTIDGVRYEADVCQECVDELVGPARKVKPRRSTSNGHRNGNGRAKRPVKRPRMRKVDNAVLREWANDNGFSVAARGKIPGAVRDAYAAAQG